MKKFGAMGPGHMKARLDDERIKKHAPHKWPLKTPAQKPSAN